MRWLSLLPVAKKEKRFISLVLLLGSWVRVCLHTAQPRQAAFCSSSSNLMSVSLHSMCRLQKQKRVTTFVLTLLLAQFCCIAWVLLNRDQCYLYSHSVEKHEPWQMFSSCISKPYIRTPDTEKHLLTQYIQNTESPFTCSSTPHLQASSCVSIGSKVLTPQKSRDPQEDGEPHPFRLHLSQQRGQHSRSTNGQIQSAHSSWCFATVVCSTTNTFLSLSSAGAFFPRKQLLLQQGSENRDHSPLSSQTNVQSEK